MYNITYVYRMEFTRLADTRLDQIAQTTSKQLELQLDSSNYTEITLYVEIESNNFICSSRNRK